MTQTKSPPASAESIESLGPWFHNLHLPGGRQTCPDHFLGDFPRWKWESIRDHVPEDLSGWTALDIGCNAGFYSFELARRGASVDAIDYDERYLRQARWAAEQQGLSDRVQFHKKQIYDLAREQRVYDLVWFMGVLYHLRHPLLGLDIAAQRTGKLMVLQTMTAPGEERCEVPDDFGLSERERLLQPGWPTMAFIEKRLANDPTNWWAPNAACVEAMVRSAGLEVIARPAHEVYICAPAADRSRVIDELWVSEFLSATGQTGEA